jgi:hypothetical protein
VPGRTTTHPAADPRPVPDHPLIARTPWRQPFLPWPADS